MTTTTAPAPHDDEAGDTPEQAAFRRQVRAFLAGNAKPAEDLGPWALNVVTDPEEARREFEEGRAWQRTRHDAGMAGFTYPTEYGGQGGEPWMERVYAEEARAYGSTSGFINATIAMLGPPLMAFGTEEQKRRYLPRLLSGEDAWCQLFSEPGAGSDLAGLGCRAVRDGDDFVLNGQKVWNSAAQFCDHGFILVRTDPDLPKHQGITFLLMEMDSPGVEVRPLVQATGSAHFNEVFLSDVRVPVADVLGEIDGGWAVARSVMSNESALIGGGQNRTFPNLRLLAEHFGRTDDPIVRQGLADAYARELVLGLMGDRILTAVRRREKPPLDPSLLKLYVTESKVRNGDLAASIAGADATLEVDEMDRWVGHEVMSRYGISIGGGTTEVQKNNLAERSLGLPREPAPDKGAPWSTLLRN